MTISFALKKMAGPTASRYLFLFVVVQIMCLASASLSTAQDTTPEEDTVPDTATKEDNSQDTTAEDVPVQEDAAYWKDVFKAFTPSAIETLQSNLSLLGYNTYGIDGKIGVNTAEALTAFRSDFEIEPTDNFPTDLAAILSYYGDVAKAHKDWREILSSLEFASWMASQPNPEEIENQIKRPKTAQEIIGLDMIEVLDAYKRHVTLSDSIEQRIHSNASQPLNDIVKVLTSYIQMENAKESEHEFAVSFKLTEAEVDAWEDIRDDRKATLKDIEYLNEGLFLKALAYAAPQVSKETASLIIERAKQTHELAQSEIKWQGDACGCAPYFANDKTVYGFYPFWMANGNVQTLDFNILSRIAYYAARFDNTGNISDALHWTKNAQFMKTAQRYRTQIDLVIYNNTWDAWHQEQLPADNLEYLADQINGLLADTSGDGVTIYLDIDIDTDNDVVYFVANLRQFIELLRGKLLFERDEPSSKEDFDEDGEGYVNVILSQDAILNILRLPDDQGDLAEILKDIDLLFVFLEQPTTYSKKLLRIMVEIGFQGKGELRQTTLRKIIPVIPPTPSVRQFDEDLIYFEDNFGGVGFWPLPIAENSEANLVQLSVQNRFPEQREHIEEMLSDLGLGLFCDFVCPNRWPFRIIFDILVAILLIYGLLCIWLLELRALFKTYFKYFLGAIVVTILTFASLLTCDPWLQRVRDEVFIVLIAVLILWWIIKRVMQTKRASYP